IPSVLGCMMMTSDLRRLLVLLPLLVVLLAAACGDDSTGPDGPPDDGIRFSFTGDRSGSFQAEGAPTFASDGSPVLTEFAFGAVGDSLHLVAGFRTGSAKTGDVFLLYLGKLQGTGSRPTNPLACAVQNLANCVMGVLGVGVDTSGGIEAILQQTDRLYI